jgi:hypothetical protein
MPKKILDLKTYIDSKTVRLENGCHVWTGLRNATNYGRIKVRQVDHLVHRVIFALSLGKDVTEVRGLVMHSCDNPPCINPDHLSEGTLGDNLLDAYSKGRARSPVAGRHGNDNFNRKLSQSDVDRIRLLFVAGYNNTEIAPMFGVHHATISLIRVGKTWSQSGESIGLARQLPFEAGRDVKASEEHALVSPPITS